jgi:hypothetical protein
MRLRRAVHLEGRAAGGQELGESREEGVSLPRLGGLYAERPSGSKRVTSWHSRLNAMLLTSTKPATNYHLRASSTPPPYTTSTPADCCAPGSSADSSTSTVTPLDQRR